MKNIKEITIALFFMILLILLFTGYGKEQSNRQDYAHSIVDITISTNDSIPENDMIAHEENNTKEVSVNEVEVISDNIISVNEVSENTPIANVKPEIVYIPTAQEQLLMDVAKEYVIGWKQGERYEDASEILQDHDIEVTEMNKMLLENYIAMEANGE